MPSQRFDVAGPSTSVTVSADLAHLPGEAPTPSAAEVLARADAAMDGAERSGRARLVHDDPRAGSSRTRRAT